MLVNKQRIDEHIKALSKFTATPGEGITRLTYSKEDVQARNYIKEKMVEYGLKVTEDGIGNIFGKREGSKSGAPSVLIGSHFDSVPNGGAYDGPAGIVAALEVAAIFHEKNITAKYPLEVIALIEEEGSRFSGGLMGSRSIAGLIQEAAYENIKDKDGISVTKALSKIGLDFSREKVRNRESIKAFLELHIEQGPILEEEEISIGVVEAVVGITQLKITISGQAGHAGTTPMDRRSDALVPAAKIIGLLPEIAKEICEGTVITTGDLQVFPNAANVIPDKVVFTIDVRSGTKANMETAYKKIESLINTYQKDGIKISIEEEVAIAPTNFSEDIRRTFREVTEELGFSQRPINSGAGHDAMIFSSMTDAGMIFVPSKDGLSHCPEEWTANEYLAQGTEVMLHAVKLLTEV